MTLDPMRVVESLAEDMPLAYAADIFARMLRERLHRHRQALILRNLHRCCNLTAAAERAEVSLLSYTVCLLEQQQEIADLGVVACQSDAVDLGARNRRLSWSLCPTWNQRRKTLSACTLSVLSCCSSSARR